MKICVFGAGAIGGFLGAKLATAGAAVSLVARGANLAAIRANGLTLRAAGQETVTRLLATDDPAELGVQDYVIVTLKANQIDAALDQFAPLLGPDTAIVTAVNGLPYWYFHRLAGPWENRILASVDPGDRQWTLLGPRRAIGCVVYPATELVAPGIVEHVYGDRFPLGEPSGEKTGRCARLSAIFAAAGLKAPVLDRIRDELWLKLWGNLCLNPISALTGATLDTIVADPGTRAVARAVMREAQAIAERLGVRFRVDLERRLDGAGKVGAHKTSMLQDLERGRPLEIDALVTVVQELGRLVGIATPTLDAVLALIQQRAQGAGLYARPAPSPAASVAAA
ncbi:MAG TPA: 2-dehydropantoate 2-reductase [Stellaceae bacterium]|nr:2-dehydropantoate 2-reductase [Stellaceae bacterium]